MPDDEAAVDHRRQDGDRTAATPDEPTGFDPPVEPGSPSLENALFVLLGVAVGLAVVLRLIQLFG